MPVAQEARHAFMLNPTPHPNPTPFAAPLLPPYRLQLRYLLCGSLGPCLGGGHSQRRALPGAATRLGPWRCWRRTCVHLLLHMQASKLSGPLLHRGVGKATAIKPRVHKTAPQSAPSVVRSAVRPRHGSLASRVQYLDSRGGVMDAICAVGAAPDASVVALTQAAMVAWAETMVRDDSARLVGGSRAGSAAGDAGDGQPAAPSPPPRLRMGVDSDGNVVAGLASWDAASLLFATEKQARELLAASAGSAGGSRGAAALDFTIRLKNFQMLFSN